MTLKEKIAALQKERVSEILNSDMGKLEKLKCLSDEYLWHCYPWLTDEFEEWRKEWLNGAKEITDSMFDPSVMSNTGRGEEVFYAERLCGINDDEQILVFSCRGNKKKLYKPGKEVIDRIYDFCVEKKIVGFTNDW